ncbi:ANPRA protein, partial [Regulus satrapa]|nr:ANPRA protein [Regulus satrapa]
LTLAVVLPQRNLTYTWAWPRVGPAVRLAAAAVNSRRDLLPGFTLGWVFGDSEDRHGVCSEMAAPLGHRKLGELGVQLHRRFNWTRRALLVYWDERVDDRPYYFAAEGLYVQLPTLRNLTVMDVVFRDGGNFSFIIQEIKAKGRSECRGRGLQGGGTGIGAAPHGSAQPHAGVRGYVSPGTPVHGGSVRPLQPLSLSQAVTIITYKEPENPEYRPFVERLKEEARDHFNFSMKDGLGGHGAME